MLLPLVLACRPTPDPLPSPAEWRAPDAWVGYELIAGSGVERTAVWVRSRAMDGTTVAGPDALLQLDGAQRQVTLDTDGYARVPVEGVDVHLADLDGNTARMFVRAPTFLDRGLHVAWPSEEVPAGDLVRAGAGLIGVFDGRVDWFAASGFRHTVLAPDTPVVGIASGHVDDDGILDAVAWTADTVYVLRGREGGLVALGRIAGRERTVAGAALGDADGDGTLDVVIAWAGGPNAGQLDVWRGDGRLGFETSPNRYLQRRPVSVTVATEREDGTPVVTVVGEEGDWERFYAYAESWSRAGPNLLLDLPGGTAHRVRDLLGNGGEDLLFAQGRAPGEERRIQLLDFNGTEVQRLSLDQPAHIGMQDLDRDGAEDLLLGTTAGRIVWIRGAEQPGSLSSSTFLDLPGRGGPVGMDPGGSVVMASTSGWRWMDSRWDGERMRPVDAGLESWGVVPAAGAFALSSGSDPHVVMVDSGGRELQTWTEQAGDRSLVGRLMFATAPQEVLDVVVCGPTAWVLTRTELLHVDLADPTAPALIGRDLVIGTHLACSEDAAVVRLGEQVLRYDAGAVPTTPTVLLGGALALHAGDLATCNTPDCRVVFAPLGPGGSRVEVVSDPEGATLAGVAIAGRGHPVVADVDADGRLDLVLHHQGEFTVHRNTLFGLAPAERSWAPQPLTGRVAIGGRRGDGSVDAWGVAASNGRLHRSPGSGPADPELPSSTGDTGAGPTDDTGR